MTSSIKLALRATALAAFAMVSASAFADFDANIELSNTYKNNGRGFGQDGRVEVNASKKAGTQYFMAGRASLVSKKDGTVATDDMWAQFGTETADIKLGRFEATNLFQTPGDVMVDHAGGVGPYNAGLLRGRKHGSEFHAAATLKLGGGLGLEIGLVESKDVAPNAGANKGVRPVLTYANGPMNLAVGFENVKSNAAGSKAETGFGITGGYDFGGFSLTANLASIKVAGNRNMGYGLIAQAGPATLGVLGGKNGVTGGSDISITTLYASYAIPFFDVKGATITPAMSFSKVDGQKDSTAGNVRINYAF